MLKRTLIIAVLAVTLAGSVDAQDAGQQGRPAPAPQPAATQVPEAQAPKPEPRPPAQLANARLELTISDQHGTTPPATKTVTMVVADRGMGRIRVSSPAKPVYLNVDANPDFTRDGRVRVQLTLEYKPGSVAGTTPDDPALTNISESLTVLLEDGKPLVVSQSADPISDRKVRVEIKATILK